MIGLALLAAAVPQSAVDAERAFAAMAQTEGQWTAFRAYAAPDAIMFTPEAGKAQAFLKDFKDPPVPVMWWPGEAWISCDGSLAVNTGPWVRPGGRSVGYFTTVWARQPDGSWKWLLDHGDVLARPRPAGETVRPRRAACSPAPTAGEDGRRYSADRTLRWSFTVAADQSRTVAAELWTGRTYETVLHDRVAAP